MRRFLALGLAVFPAWSGIATEYSIDPAESVFAVVVHKAGVAARFAHNHLIYPEAYDASLSIEGADAATASFKIEFPVSKLRVDTPEAHRKWSPGIEKAGILDKPFSELEEGDRKTIVDHMLAKDQLNAEEFPAISAKIVSLRLEPSTHGKQNYTHAATIEFTVRNKSVERECPAQIVVDGDTLTVDAMGAFTFSEFGIKPYSAMLGAVKNADEFHVFVHIAGAKKVETSP